MSIDPKKGGQCWSCKHCEDIGTPNDDPNGSYYRKCTKSGHEYLDTCKFYCSDYVWDGVHDRYTGASSSASSASSKSTPSSSKPSSVSGSTGAASSGSKKSGCLPWTLLILLLLAYAGFFMMQNFLNNVQPNTGAENSIQATESKDPVAYVNISGTLNLRIGPGQSYDIITEMPDGAKVFVQETKSGWSYVSYQGQSGWCFTEHLDFAA